MTSVFPTLGQQFDYSSHKGALILLTEYASPKRLRRLGETRLIQWLRRRQVRDAARVAARALAAARGQDIELPGQHVAEMIIAELAASLLQLDQRIHGLDQQIAATFRRHHQAIIIESMPGFGPILGAQLLVAAGRPPRLPQRRPPGRCSRPGAGPQRLWPTIRQPAQTAPLQPTATARVLSVRADQHDAGRSQPCLLPQETGWRSHPRPGRHHPRPPPHRRPLGPPTPTVRSKLHSSTYSGVEVSTEVEATHGTALSCRKDFIAHSVCRGLPHVHRRLPLPVRGDHPASGPDPYCRLRCHRNRDDGSLTRLCPPRPGRPGRLGPFDPCSGPGYGPAWRDGS